MRFLKIRFTPFLKRKLGIISPPTVVPFRGYGSPSQVYVHGAVMENKPIFSSRADHRKRKNFHTMLARYLSTPLSGKDVQIDFEGQTYEATSGHHGYFKTWIHPLNALSPGWHSITYTLLGQEENKKPNNGDFLIVD